MGAQTEFLTQLGIHKRECLENIVQEFSELRTWIRLFKGVSGGFCEPQMWVLRGDFLRNSESRDMHFKEYLFWELLHFGKGLLESESGS